MDKVRKNVRIQKEAWNYRKGTDRHIELEEINPEHLSEGIWNRPGNSSGGS